MYIKLSENASAPLRATEQSAGFDLAAAEDVVLLPGETKSIKTDLHLSFPSGTYGRIAARSGLAIKHSITVIAGVVDPDYTGNVAIILHNLSTKNKFQVKIGMRIAQIICEKIELVHNAVEIKENQRSNISMNKYSGFDEVDGCKRGSNGFGSTGY